MPAAADYKLAFGRRCGAHAVLAAADQSDAAKDAGWVERHAQST